MARARTARNRHVTLRVMLPVLLVILFLGFIILEKRSAGQNLIVHAVRFGSVFLALILLGALIHGSPWEMVQRALRCSLQRQALHHRDRSTQRLAGAEGHMGNRTVRFAQTLSAKCIPSVRAKLKGGLWWQSEDFAEFLCMHVVIGRAYHAVAKMRGVKVDEDFPVEPVLAHESRLGLRLGGQSRTGGNGKECVIAVLQEQARQVFEMYDEEPGDEKGAVMVDLEMLANVSRNESRKYLDDAVKEAERHHKEVLKDLAEPQEEDEEGEEEPPLSSLQKAQISPRTSSEACEARAIRMKATPHCQNLMALARAPALDVCTDTATSGSLTSAAASTQLASLRLGSSRHSGAASMLLASPRLGSPRRSGAARRIKKCSQNFGLTREELERMGVTPVGGFMAEVEAEAGAEAEEEGAPSAWSRTNGLEGEEDFLPA